MIAQIPHLIKLKSYLTVYQLVSLFIKDERLRKAFSFHPLLVGGSPLDTTSIYCLIHHVEREWGIWFPKGGTGALVNALKKLMLEEEIKILNNTEVEEILINKDKVTGVRVKDGESIKSDIVVCNGDPSFTYLNLINKSARKGLVIKKYQDLNSLWGYLYGTSVPLGYTKMWNITPSLWGMLIRNC